MTTGAEAESRTDTLRVAGICAAVLVVLAIARVLIDGWEALSADHARYVYSGLSLLHGRGYVNEIGDPFLFRAPAFALIAGGGWQLGGSIGAHLAVAVLGIASLLLAVGLAARLGGPVGAIGATAALMAVPLFWEQVVGLGIDQPQAAFVLAAIVLLGEASPGRWLAAGALLGVGILVKETLALAAILLPLAWLPAWTPLAWSRWLRLTAVFALTTTIVAGWWWIVVWQATGQIFPLNALQAIVPDDLPLELTVSVVGVVSAGIGALAWVAVIAARMAEPRARLLVLGALSTLPAAAATIALAQAPRNLTTLVLLTCIAIGVGASELWARMGPATSHDARSRRLGTVVVGALATVLLALAVVGQATAQPAAQDPLSTATSEVLRPRVAPGDHIVSTFRNRSTLGVELFDHGTAIALVPVRAVDAARDPSAYLWLGVRRGTLFGIRRDRWVEVLGAPGASHLVVSVPHGLSPAELLPALRGRPGRRAGLTEVARVDTANGTAYVFANEPDSADAMTDVPLHTAPNALLLWLDQARARGESGAVTRLLASEPVIPHRAPDARALARRLGDRACFRPAREGGRRVVVIEVQRGQDDCLARADLR